MVQRRNSNGLAKSNGIYLYLLISVAFLAFGMPSQLWGSVSGSISGIVTDPSGRVVPQAQVMATNIETGVHTATRTNSVGFYSFPQLPIGNYEIVVRRQGFMEFRETGLVVNTNSALRADVQLKVGGTRQSITVSTTPVHVQTTSTQMGEVITGTAMTSLPLNGRSYTDLLALQPGVAPRQTGEYTHAPSGATTTPSGDLNSGNLSVSGGRESGNGFIVNGGAVNMRGNNGAGAIPNLDSIAEFRILTNNFDTQYGNAAGGIVNVVTKSGTNQFHGDAFEFLRNPNLDARNFYSPNRAVLHRNQFGGAIGGPIVHNKAFFFGDYQGTRQVQGVDTGLISVPSAAERNGDFSSLSNKLTGNVSGPYFANILSTDLGYPVNSGEPYYTSGCTTASQCVFPNAVIPTAAFSAPAKALLQYIPLPNAPGGFFTSSAQDETIHDNKWSAKTDLNSQLGRISAYYFFDDWENENPYSGGSLPGTSAGATFGRAQQAVLSDTKSFGATALNEVLFSYVRNSARSQLPTNGIGVSLASQGFAPANAGGIYVTNPAIEGVEPVATSDFSFGIESHTHEQHNNTYETLDNFSKILGTHTIKFGGQLAFYQINLFVHAFNQGAFVFNGRQTGSYFADYLIGSPTRYHQGFQLPQYTRSHYLGLYAQDSWRATHNLTINYGLRWDVTTPWSEIHNQLETLIYGKQSSTFPGSPLGWVFPGDPGVPHTIANTQYGSFAPRLGIAYSPSASEGLARWLFGGPGKSSIRAGAGMFYANYVDGGSFNGVGDAPFGFFYGSPVPPLFSAPFIDLASGNSQGQRFPAPFPPPNASPANPDSSINFSQFEPISSSPVWNHTNRTPYTENFMFSIQRQFPTDTLLGLSYVGTRGHRLLVDEESNVGNPALCLSVSQVSQVTNGVTCGPDGENGVYYPITGGVIDSTRGPFGPAFGANALFSTAGNSNYNALEVSVKHMTHGMTFLGSYTYSKSLDTGSSLGTGGEIQNPVNPKLTKALSAFDSTNNFVFSYVSNLPFDKLFRSNRLSELTGGWQITGITSFSTGLPVMMVETDDRSLLGACGNGPGGCADVPNFTPGTVLNNTNPRSGQPYFNISLFSHDTLGHIGTANRRFFHGPGIANFDIGILKNVRLSEKFRLEIRGEFFNIFNHAQFGQASGDINTSTFGYVTSARSPRIGQVAMKLFF